MDVTLLSDRYQPLQCPFCGSHEPPKRPSPSRKPAMASNDYAVFTPNRCTQVQATRKQDKKTLRMGKAGVESQIEKAAMLPLRGARGCFIRLPATIEYELVLIDDGRLVYRPLTELVVFAPGSVYSITNISVEISITQSFSFSQTGFNYQAGGRQRPTLRVAGDAAGTNGYYEVSGFELAAGANFSAERQNDGRMAFRGDDVESFDIYAESVGETETETFDFDGIEVGDDGQALLDIEADGDSELDIDSDSDGQSDEEDVDDDNDGDLDSEDEDDATEDVEEDEDGEEEAEEDESEPEADEGDEDDDSGEGEEDEEESEPEAEDEGEGEEEAEEEEAAENEGESEEGGDEGDEEPPS